MTSDFCPRRTSERWSAYVDGTMALREREEHVRHVAACGECARVVRGLEVIVGSARAFAGAPPPAGLWPRIESALIAEQTSRASRRGAGEKGTDLRRWTPPGATRLLLAASMALAASLAVWQLRPDGATAATGRGEEVDSATTLAVRETLGTIDRVIADLEVALQRAPGDPYLLRLMETARQERAARAMHVTAVLARVR